MSVLFVLKHALLPSFLIVKVRSSKADTEWAIWTASPCPGEQWAWPHVLCCLQRLRTAHCPSCSWLISPCAGVRSPSKTQPILDILLKNQAKLIEFLSKFQNDRTGANSSMMKGVFSQTDQGFEGPAQQEAWFPINTENIKSKFSVCCSLFSIRHCYQFMRNITANLLLYEPGFHFTFFDFFCLFFSVKLGLCAAAFLHTRAHVDFFLIFVSFQNFKDSVCYRSSEHG